MRGQLMQPSDTRKMRGQIGNIINMKEKRRSTYNPELPHYLTRLHMMNMTGHA